MGIGDTIPLIPMGRFSEDREALDFIASRVADEAQREGVPFSEVERKMLYFSETAWTLPDIWKINDEFDTHYDQPTYEKKVSQLIKKAVSRACNENPDELEHWKQSVSLLSHEDRFLLIMVEQARLGAAFRTSQLRRPPRPAGDLWKLWGTGVAVVAFFGSLSWLAHKLFPRVDITRESVTFVIWATMVLIAVVFAIVRWVVGARKFDDVTARALEWIFETSKRRT